MNKLGPFAEAISSDMLVFDGYISSCVYDVCRIPDDEHIHCQTLEDAVYVSSQHQITIDPIWRVITNCRMYSFYHLNIIHVYINDFNVE